MSQRLDIEAALPAIMEAASTHRAACDDFEKAVEIAREQLSAAAEAVITAVAICREVGLEVGNPFDIADPVGRSLDMIHLIRHPIRFACEI